MQTATYTYKASIQIWQYGKLCMEMQSKIPQSMLVTAKN